jgi:hypothetical protein
VRGDPSSHIEDIESIETVWSNGGAYDPNTLLAQVKGESTDRVTRSYSAGRHKISRLTSVNG